MALRIIITVVVAYLLGNVNGAILVSRVLAHDDVRNHGSGNAGLTNFFRNYGGLRSLLVIGIDCVKAVAACLLGQFLLAPLGYSLEGAAIGAVAVGIGHDFPALLNFKGGKGILSGFACSWVLDWRVALVTFFVFATVYLLTKYVSLSSILGATTLAVSFALWNWDRPWAVVCCTIMCVLAIVLHHENIGRLLKGNERKTYFFSTEKKK